MVKVHGKKYLSHRGYGIEKHDNEKLVESLKKELTVSPKVNPMMINTEVSSFPVYRENEKKIYVPRYYGLSKFGIPDVYKLSDGIDCPNLIFEGTIRDQQKEPIDAFINAVKEPLKMGGILSLPCGFGKCLGMNTPILMYDGSIKVVQEVTVGDLLMGDDSTPRKVLSICRGQEEMFDIISSKGNTYYTVNRSHILSLTSKEGSIVDLSVDDYLKLSKPFQELLYGYRVGVNFPYKEVPMEPYQIGYQLGYHNQIPSIYKYNSQEVRLKVLAGILDFHESLTIHVESERLIEDILYLARSLGFAAYKTHSQTSYSTTIHGKGMEDIPTKVHIPPNDEDALITRITLKSIGVRTYYGFEIDGNHRFLLGDFTVTHNTVCALYLATHFKKKTLIICHTNFLIDQWIERINQYIPKASVGKIKQSKCEVKGRDIVIASLQSLAMREYDSSIFEEFGYVVSDECHHISAEVFSRCLPKITCKRMLGLSATLKRKDGLSKVFEWYIGKPVYEIKRKDSEVKVLVKRYYDPHTSYSKEVKIWNSPNKLNVAKMINNICGFSPRNYMIIQTLKEILVNEPNRKVLILSERRNHLQELENLLSMEKYTSIGYYVGGMNKQQLDKGSEADIILATFQLASEAMDIPKLNTLVLSSPVSSVEQPVGRIQRKKKEDREYIPLVIDILDEFSLFERQGAKRIAFYKKNEYEIEDAIKQIKENLMETRKYSVIKDDDDINIAS